MSTTAPVPPPPRAPRRQPSRRSAFLVLTLGVLALAVALLASPFAPADAASTDPTSARSFTWRLDVDGFGSASFQEVSGLGSENEVIDHRVVGPDGVEVVRRIPGRLRFDSITLKRGVTSDADMWTWRAVVEDGDLTGARRNATVSLLDGRGVVVAQWTITNAWPSSVTVAPTGLDGTVRPIEVITVEGDAVGRGS